MAELDNKEELDTTEDVDTNEDYQEDNQNEESQDQSQDKDEYSREEVMVLKTKADRLEKAEKKLVELKRVNKSIKKEDAPFNSREELEKFYEEKEFFKNNPEANSYKEKMAEYKGLSLDDQYLLASRKDKEIEKNREVYGQSFVKGQANNENLPTVSIDAFDKMTSVAQSEYTQKMTSKYGKVKFK